MREPPKLKRRVIYLTDEEWAYAKWRAATFGPRWTISRWFRTFLESSMNLSGGHYSTGAEGVSKVEQL